MATGIVYEATPNGMWVTVTGRRTPRSLRPLKDVHVFVPKSDFAHVRDVMEQAEGVNTLLKLFE